MKFVVCIKQVPEVSELRFDNVKRTLIREGVRNEINPFDRRALTFAVEAKKKHDGEVVVFTMGPPQAKEALMEALATGADRAVHLLDRAFAGSDTLATARALSLAIQKEYPFDMVLCGKYSVDAETGHIGPEVAQLLGIGHVSGATKIEFTQSFNHVLIESETDYGFQTTKSTLPVLVTAAERLIKPTRPTTQGVEAAKLKPYRIVTASELTSDTSTFGFKGSPTSVNEIYSIEVKRRCMIIDGPTTQEKAKTLVQTLIQHGLFTGWRKAKTLKIKPPDQRNITGNKAFWTIAEVVRGKVREVTYELLGRGLQLSEQIDSELCAVLIGDGTEEFSQDLINHGADRVYIIQHEELSKYSSDAYASALAETIQTYHPYAVIAPATSFGRDFVPRVAAQLGLGMTSDCIGLEINDELQLVQLKPAFGGNIVAPIISSTHPQLATIRPGMLPEAESNPSRKGIVVRVHPKLGEPLSKVEEERVDDNSNTSGLDNADVVVCVGFGVGGPENIGKVKGFAELLNAPLAATRKVVDLEWMPRQLQIGLTGRSIAPRLYFALGVSGAFNHMVGVGRANFIVAINKDPNALIFKNCDYGIVGDYAEVLPSLTEEMRMAKLGRA
ncbi:MAG: FAD-binding protein [Candidatus Bathyarchaeia archaeon]|jgi:electron transfer flavoprotein alpha subunit